MHEKHDGIAAVNQEWHPILSDFQTKSEATSESIKAELSVLEDRASDLERRLIDSDASPALREGPRRSPPRLGTQSDMKNDGPVGPEPQMPVAAGPGPRQIPLSPDKARPRESNTAQAQGP